MAPVGYVPDKSLNNNAANATFNYMKKRLGDNGDAAESAMSDVKNKGSFSLGNIDERYKFAEACYNLLRAYFWAMIILIIILAVILGFTIYYDTNKHKFKGKDMEQYFSMVIIISGSLIAIAGGFVFFSSLSKTKIFRGNGPNSGYSKSKTIDATLTDITRLSTSSMTETELHSALTNTVANRVGMSDQDIAQLHYNIANSISFTGNDINRESLGATQPASVNTTNDLLQSQNDDTVLKNFP